mgnify:CR=1 FL=1
MSDSKKSGGNVGWIYKNQLSKEITDAINKINIGDFTRPLVTSGGFLVLKLNDVNTENIRIDKDAQLKTMVEFEKDKQFTRFSPFFSKINYNHDKINTK